MYRKNCNTLEEFEQKCAKLTHDLSVVDPQFVDLVLENIYLKCVRVGYIWKCTHRVLKSDEWSEKFVVLTNCGFVYFNTKKDGDYDPRKFYPLNDFQIKDLDEKVSIHTPLIFNRRPRGSMRSRSFSREPR